MKFGNFAALMIACSLSFSTFAKTCPTPFSLKIPQSSLLAEMDIEPVVPKDSAWDLVILRHMSERIASVEAVFERGHNSFIVKKTLKNHVSPPATGPSIVSLGSLCNLATPNIKRAEFLVFMSEKSLRTDFPSVSSYVNLQTAPDLASKLLERISSFRAARLSDDDYRTRLDRYSRQNYKKAIALLDELAAPLPRVYETYLYKAKIHLQNDNPKEAWEDASIAAILAPEKMLSAYHPTSEELDLRLILLKLGAENQKLKRSLRKQLKKFLNRISVLSLKQRQIYYTTLTSGSEFKHITSQPWAQKMLNAFKAKNLKLNSYDSQEPVDETRDFRLSIVTMVDSLTIAYAPSSKRFTITKSNDDEKDKSQSSTFDERRWSKFLACVDKLKVHEWHGIYVPEDVMDGQAWEFTFCNQKDCIDSRGHESYPHRGDGFSEEPSPHFDEFVYQALKMAGVAEPSQFYASKLKKSAHICK